MRAFTFKEVKYFKLEELFDAFADDFNEALKSVSTKEFISFIKQFGKTYKQIANILYRTRYLQNALSIIIYNYTKDKRLVIFGHEYKTLEEISNNINAEGCTLFASENGFSRTIIANIPDQKQKMDWIAFESVYKDPFAIRFIMEYAKYDSNDYENKVLKPLLAEVSNPFINAYELLSQDETHLILAHKYSLEAVLKIRNWPCPIFSTLELIKDSLNVEQVKYILGESFYLWVAEHINEYKFKGGKARLVKKHILKLFKELKKTKSSSVNLYCGKHRDMFVAYVEMMELYNRKKIVPVNQSAEIIVPYQGVLLPRAFAESFELIKEENDSNRIEIPKEKYKYNLTKLERGIKKNRKFSNWLITLPIIFFLYLGVPAVLESMEITDINLSIFQYQETGLPTLVYFGCLILMLLIAVIYKIHAHTDFRRLNKLCRLAYYQNNRSILKDKEIDRYNKLIAAEEKLAKKITHGYRFFGCLALMALSMVVTIIVYSLNLSFNFIVTNEAYAAPFIYLIFVPALFCLLTGMLRHKKDFFSILLCLIFSVALACGCLYLVANFLV